MVRQHEPLHDQRLFRRLVQRVSHTRTRDHYRCIPPAFVDGGFVLFLACRQLGRCGNGLGQRRREGAAQHGVHQLRARRRCGREHPRRLPTNVRRRDLHRQMDQHSAQRNPMIASRSSPPPVSTQHSTYLALGCLPSSVSSVNSARCAARSSHRASSASDSFW